MADPPRRSRRRFLRGLASVVGVGSLAGCARLQETEPSDGSADGTGTSPEADGVSDETATSGPETGTEPQLDRREANVVEVVFERADGSYTFDVTMHHDDDGEEGYANWWQVERLDGTRLGRRDLLHAHSRQPFTRSATIEIPAEVNCVVVRGHDQTHGYGGQLISVDLESGENRAVEQGSEPLSVEEGDCPG